MGYIFSPDELTHFSCNTLIGGGSIETTLKPSSGETRTHNETFFILEPEVGIESNLADFFRINIGVSYRCIIEREDISNFALNLNFMFGRF
ncbi:hypothetical protein K9N50_08960 [bacterium]|nr:hypothetical protein [bacterium]